MVFMAYNFAGGGDGDQVFLMPPDPRDWLPPRHLAWAMRQAARELDLAPFLAAYRADGQGKTAYHPRMMVALVMYCYAKGIRSSRAIEMATFDDVGARVICGGLHPDHATIARFVTRHKEPVKGLLVQSLAACAREGLVRVDVMAGDGTKVKANASMAANADRGAAGAGHRGAGGAAGSRGAAWIEQARAADAAEDALFARRGWRPPPGGPRPGRAASGRRACWPAARRRRRSWPPKTRPAGSRPRRSGRSKIAKLAAEKERLEARAAEEQAKARPRWPATPGAPRRPPPGTPAAGRPRPLARGAAARRPRRRRPRPRGPRASWRRRSPPPPSRRPGPPGQGERHRPGQPGHAAEERRLRPAVQRAGPRRPRPGHPRHRHPRQPRRHHRAAPAARAAAANLDAAGITDKIGKALFDAGYASEANFTAPCQAELYVAVTRESVQAGQLRRRHGPAAQPARLAGHGRQAGHPRRPGPLQAAQGASSSRSSPSCSPASAAP